MKNEGGGFAALYTLYINSLPLEGKVPRRGG